MQLVELSIGGRRARFHAAAQVAEAVREGLRREAAPVGRQLAEVRGMAVQLLRRLERLETISPPSGTRASTTSACSST